ncbi:hypothetical protein BBK36DRAFT_1127272 [Trichoderma citrinoviride]|uniref:Uncharacterized protein n=1 Tax=Trichoderma citrinoviride TaxID=58853 RepID=A0A2T4B1N7_9HYPO|nr:hypothetical protein BBK36DRAFT_1127272 [Trichoderma citrinoviride]PTB63243.1 hypothetical protein BBK36DRAFT_1127272 [Trichoderma citrinoviride]
MPASFVDDESGSKEFLIEHRPAEKKTTRQWSFLFVSLAILTVIGLIELIVLAIIFGQLSPQNHIQPLLSELNHLVPTFSTRQVLFRTDPSATVDQQDERSRNKTRENWLSYMPRGNGFIEVNHTDKYILPEPILFKGKQVYSLAVFHQLHCLYAIMDMYNNLTSPAQQTQTGSAQQATLNISSDSHGHINHCFRYLRQSLLCCGDTALEGQIPNSNISGTDGTGAVHMCKDFEAIRSWAEEKRLDDRKHP